MKNNKNNKLYTLAEASQILGCTEDDIINYYQQAFDDYYFDKLETLETLDEADFYPPKTLSEETLAFLYPELGRIL